MIYKFAAADMDGTLLNDKNEITPYTIEIIRQAAAQGLIFSICTGRPIQGVERYQKQLGIQGPVITYNGAMILSIQNASVSRIQDHMIVHHDLSKVPAYFDQVLLLHRKLIAFGKTEETFTKENLHAAYGHELFIGGGVG